MYPIMEMTINQSKLLLQIHRTNHAHYCDSNNNEAIVFVPNLKISKIINFFMYFDHKNKLQKYYDNLMFQFENIIIKFDKSKNHKNVNIFFDHLMVFMLMIIVHFVILIKL